ncbi:lipase, class 3 [Shewanella denitrificans OS217]|jgi:triacylglycerol lipase|uniref:Lipase, class 3 n=1 Tax=Shewanella denitrificans (strain OS217 / ATCC BAA-1090 / DSM 15013) TaxID=318161 RepID=Q12RN3_SHEDO|nr:lipase family protein [Shewanella denitrificans]ABE53893.1 lipase, class 3 [Shewanella denitrificans OS217]
MTTAYLTSINATDKNKVLQLMEASLQAYQAFNTQDPMDCQLDGLIPPQGFEYVDYWTGVDAIFNRDKTLECYGVVFRTLKAPFKYIFAFRGTASFLDVLDDLGTEKRLFVPFDVTQAVPAQVQVESGFFDVYSDSKSDSQAPTPSMQQQVFSLLDKYNASDKPIAELLITGHSLGSALSELFTLDVAVSRPKIMASNINFACPRVGNSDFVQFYMQQGAQQDPSRQTLRVQNTYDKVPCVPPTLMGYQHIPHALLIAFHKDSLLGKFDFLDSHASANYSAVLIAAAKNQQGVCVDERLPVGATDFISSQAPNPNTIGLL